MIQLSYYLKKINKLSNISKPGRKYKTDVNNKYPTMSLPLTNISNPFFNKVPTMSTYYKLSYLFCNSKMGKY